MPAAARAALPAGRPRPGRPRPGCGAPDPSRFRAALGRFASGVTVITALDEARHLCGLTASAFTSVSLDPPLVLACVGRAASCHRSLMAAGQFSVHILHEGQADVAKGFARSGADRSAVCAWSITDLGLPLLDDFHAALECSLHDAHPGGDHTILVGRVQRIHLADADAGPLVSYDGALLSLQDAIDR